MTHPCSLCHGSGFYAAGLACPYNDVHGAAMRLTKNPQSNHPPTNDERSAASLPAPDLNHQGTNP